MTEEKTEEQKEQEKKTQEKVVQDLSGNGLTIEKEARVIGDMGVRVATPDGRQTHVTVNKNNVEASGENAREVEQAAKGSGKVVISNTGSLSELQQKAIDNINSQDLSDAEKRKAIAKVTSAKDLDKEGVNPEELAKGKLTEYGDEVRGKVADLEARKQEAEKGKDTQPPGWDAVDRIAGTKPKEKEDGKDNKNSIDEFNKTPVMRLDVLTVVKGNKR